MDWRRLALLVTVLLVTASGCAGLELGASPAGTSDNVTVIGIVDGDTIDVRYENGSSERVRLLGVDTPEVHVETDPEEFEGVPNTTAGRDCLRSVGQEASSFVRERIGDADVRLEGDPTADRRGSYGRLLAYVYYDADDENLNYRLVADGYARVYETEFTERERFDEAQGAAKEAGIGVWRCRDV